MLTNQEVTTDPTTPCCESVKLFDTLLGLLDLPLGDGALPSTCVLAFDTNARLCLRNNDKADRNRVLAFSCLFSRCC